MNETKRDRITADISRGNSGGGVFYGNSLIGIATANFLEERQMPWNMLIPVPGEEGMGLLHGSGTVTTVSAVPGWSEMVNARQIRNMLEDAHLSFVVDKRPNLVSVYLAVLLNLILLLVLLRSCCEVIWNITGKKMC
jgi:hypothetical protein